MTRPKHLHRPPFLGLTLLTCFQLLCAGFFISEFLTEVLGLRRWALPFAWREVLQILASLGLVIGSVTSILLLQQSKRRMALMQRQIREASGAFHDAMMEFFTDWGLSPSEQDVAMFALRSYGNANIANLRGTSEATVKSQLNAVFRKATVGNRAQLMGIFVDAMMAEENTAKAQAMKHCA